MMKSKTAISGENNNVYLYSRQRQYPSIDIVKFICSILVVTIHVNPLADINSDLAYYLAQCVARLAVPFFFVAGGYFCFRKTTPVEFDFNIPLKYAKRMFKLYLLWTLIYLPSILYGAYTDEKGFMFGLFGGGGSANSARCRPWPSLVSLCFGFCDTSYSLAYKI